MSHSLKSLHTALISLLLGLVALLCMSCVSQTPTPKYADNLNFAAVYLHDDTHALTTAPIQDDVASSLTDVLTQRNLGVSPVAFSSIQNEITSIRDTERRIQALNPVAQNAQFILLVELNTEFYSPLSGRYRWNVHAKVTIYDLVTHTTISDSITIPAVLMYAHETGDDAIASVLTDLQRQVASLVDRFLSGRILRPDKKQAPPTGTGAMQTPPVQSEASLTGGASPSPQAIYFILIDRFFNAQTDNDLDTNPAAPNAWHGGDLAGIQAKLPYLHDLGFTQLWLSPVFAAAHENFFSNAAFHAYWTYDLNQIDPHFGTQNDLLNLARSAQSQHIGIILDFVVNHVGYGSPLVEQKPNWFHPALTIEDWNDPVQLTDRQVHGLPDLDQSNPEVAQYLIQAAQKYLALPNISGLRLDAVKHVRLDFWKSFNTQLRQRHPNAILLGEYFDGDPAKVDDIQKNGNFTHMFDFPLAFALRDVFCENKPLANLASVVANDRFYKDPTHMVTFLDNHDMPRILSLCQGDTDAVRRGLKTLLAWRGIPGIYYGTEVPLPGDKEPFNRADMDFSNPKLAQTLKTGLAHRNQWPVLAFGTTAVLDFSSTHVLFARQYLDQQAIIAISQADAPLNLTLPDGTWTDLDTAQTLSQSLTLPPRAIRILTRKNTIPILRDASVTLTFRAPNDGATYALAGSLPQLGLWNPQKAPRFSAANPLQLTLPAHTVATFKPVRITEDGQFQWPDGDNHALFITKPQTIDVSW